MFGRSKGPTLTKPKKVHSLEYLKYLYTVIQKNLIVNDQNTAVIVEALRLIAEILIWGDQNDSSVMDFFLEKNILEHFLKFMKQNPGRIVCVQLLQTLNILFENISNKTAILKDEGALEFVHHQTSVPYFSYLVWSIGTTILDIDALLRSDLGPQTRTRLDALVAEHVDYLHYLNDLLSLNIEGINDVLCDQLLHRLFIPMHVYSLTKRFKPTNSENVRVQRPHVSHPVAACVLTHTLVILHHPDVIRLLTESIFFGDPSLTGLVPAVATSDSLVGPDGGDLETTNEDFSPIPVINDLHTTSSDESSEDELVGSGLKDPANAIAQSLVTASMAMRDARSAPAGCRLSAYMKHTRQAPRNPNFAQPGESLETSLKHAKGVSPELINSIWPVGVSPLRLVQGQKTQSIPIVKAPTLLNEVTSRPRPDSSPSSPTSSTISDIVGIPSNNMLKQGSMLLPTEPNLLKSKMFPVGSTPAFLSEISNTVSAKEETQSVNSLSTQSCSGAPFSLQGLPFLRSLYRALEVGPGTDYATLFALFLFAAVRCNPAIDTSTLQAINLGEPGSNKSSPYDGLLVEKLLNLVSDACKAASRVRLITLHQAIRLLTDLVCDSQKQCHLSDAHFAQLISCREEAMMVLRSYFKNDAIFLDLFEHEVCQLQIPFQSLAKLTMDSELLVPPMAASVLPPAMSTMSSLDATRRPHWRRLPQMEPEHTQRSIVVFLLVHIWLESLLRVRPATTLDEELTTPCVTPISTQGEQGNATTTPTMSVPGLYSNNLPVDLALVPGLAGLGAIPDCKSSTVPPKAGDKLDLSSEALIGCTVESGGSHEKRFLVNYSQQLVLVEPDSRQIGWGVITFIGPLQNLEAICDPADSRCLHVTISPPGLLTSVAMTTALSRSNPTQVTPARGITPRPPMVKPYLVARFLFEDHIRCMTARQMLIRGRELARQTRLRKIATNSFTGINYTGSPGNAPNNLGLGDDRTTATTAVSRQPGASGYDRMAANRFAGTFLMKRQPHRKPDKDHGDTHIPLTSLTSPAISTSHPVAPPRSPRSIAAAAATTTVTSKTYTRLIDSVVRTPVTLVQQQLPNYPDHCAVVSVDGSGSVSTTLPPCSSASNTSNSHVVSPRTTGQDVISD